MSQSTVSTTTWTCDLCGETSTERMDSLWAPGRHGLHNLSTGRPEYERCDLCISCIRHYHISDVMAWFRRGT